MRIIPHSSFTGDIALADYPGLEMYFDLADFPSAGVLETAYNWTCRKTGNVITITPNAGEAISKDAEGVYADGVPSIAITGTMPTISAGEFVVVASIGKATSSSSISGAIITFGGDEANKLSLSSTAVAKYNSVALNTTPVFSPAALTSLNKRLCMTAYYDFTAGTANSPRISKVVANTNFTDAVSTTFAEGTTTSTNGITPGQLAQAMAFSSMGASTTARQGSFMLFSFATPVTYNELKLAAIEMARTRKPYAGWRNKA